MKQIGQVLAVTAFRVQLLTCSGSQPFLLFSMACSSLHRHGIVSPGDLVTALLTLPAVLVKELATLT